MRKFLRTLTHQSPSRMIALGFATVIFIGTGLLLLPISVRPGADVSLIGAFFTSTSAVCVTGLLVIDVADHFTPFGQGVVAVLIQIGGLGLTSIGAGLMIAAGRRVSFKSRLLVKEALNIGNYKGIVKLLKSILTLTLCFEACGAALSFLVFAQDYPLPHALGISIFHSIAAFNNSGFDILGNMQNLAPYRDNVFLNLTTCGLVIIGGLGYLVLLDIARCRSFRKLSLHSKVVITVSATLLAAGTLLLKATEDISWMGAFFHSVSARTAGFSTYPIGSFTNAGLFVLCFLMFIGASPGSTGGGIKTSTLFILIQAVRSMYTDGRVHAFRRSISPQNIFKASTIALLSGGVVCIGTFLMCVLEPQYSFMQIFFEVVSAFGTAGLSTGITPGLSLPGKLVIICIMFTGRLGAVTLLSAWMKQKEPAVRYSEETIAIG